jgi:hypothetical protein
MSNLGMGISAGISSGLQTFMAQLPGIIQQHNKQAYEGKGKKLLDDFDAANPLEIQGANVPAQQAPEQPLDPNGQTQAPMEQMSMAQPNRLDPRVNPEIQPVPRAETALQELSDNQGAPTMKVDWAPTFEDWVDSTVTQESGKNYNAKGPETKHGRALGKYQIIPKFHFQKIGLNPDSKQDQEKFLKTPELQDELGKMVAKDAWDSAGGDPIRASYKYYTGRTDPKNPDAIPTGPDGTPTGPAPRFYAKKVSDRMFENRKLPTSSATQSETKKESLLTNLDSYSEAAKGINDLLGEVSKGGPKYEKGRMTKKLEYFYENASPDVIAAMEPTLKKLESMADNEKAEFINKANQWGAEIDKKTRLILGKAQLEATLEWKKNAEETKNAIATAKTAAEQAKIEKENKIKELTLTSKNIQNAISNYDDIIAKSKSGKKTEREDFMRKNASVFSEQTEKKTLLGVDWLAPDTKKWVTDTAVRSKLQKEFDDVQERLRQIIQLPDPTTSIPTGEAMKTPDFNQYFTPVD